MSEWFYLLFLSIQKPEGIIESSQWNDEEKTKAIPGKKQSRIVAIMWNLHWLGGGEGLEEIALLVTLGTSTLSMVIGV